MKMTDQALDSCNKGKSSNKTSEMQIKGNGKEFGELAGQQLGGGEELGQHRAAFDEEAFGSEEAGRARLFHENAGRLCGLLPNELGLDRAVVWLPEPR